MTESTFLEQLSFTHKRTLVGNLLRCDCSTSGFGRLKWMERDLSTTALRGFVIADSALVDAVELEFRWRPDKVVARYSSGDWVIDERKTIRDDTLVVQLTIRSVSPTAQTIGLVFLS